MSSNLFLIEHQVYNTYAYYYVINHPFSAKYLFHVFSLLGNSCVNVYLYINFSIYLHQ
jgi:hypothetical protein